MAVLAFDCCLRSLSVAVLADGRVTVCNEAAPEGGQAERLLPLIAATLANAGKSYADLTKVAVTLGPGGFTSVRVGIAAARGLALALGIPAVGQSSLEALAASAVAAGIGAARRIVVTVPAGRGGQYWQEFDVAGQPLSGPRVVEAFDNETVALLPSDALVGPGSSDVLAGWVGDTPALVMPTIAPRADLIAISAKHLTQSSELRPIYLRPADARPEAGKSLARA